MRLNNRILENAVLLGQIEKASTVSIYWPCKEWREIDTRPLIRDLLDHNKRVVLPVVQEFTRERGVSPRIIHKTFAKESELQPNRWGILEPLNGIEVNPSEIDLVFTPALCIDRLGYRIGYGYGYYDEILSTTRSPAVCLIYRDNLFDKLPADEFDRPVSVIVTELEIIHVGAM